MPHLSKKEVNGGVENEIKMSFVKSKYVVRGFMLKLEDYVEEGSFIQESESIVQNYNSLWNSWI